MTGHRQGPYTRAEVQAYVVRVLRSAWPLVLILMVLVCPVLTLTFIYLLRMPDIG